MILPDPGRSCQGDPDSSSSTGHQHGADSPAHYPLRLDISLRSPVPGESAVVRCSSSIVRQRDWSDDFSEDPSGLPAEISARPGGGPQGETLAHRLLEHAFYNDGNTCFQNSVMFC